MRSLLFAFLSLLFVNTVEAGHSTLEVWSVQPAVVYVKESLRGEFVNKGRSPALFDVQVGNVIVKIVPDKGISKQRKLHASENMHYKVEFAPGIGTKVTYSNPVPDFAVLYVYSPQPDGVYIMYDTWPSFRRIGQTPCKFSAREGLLSVKVGSYSLHGFKVINGQQYFIDAGKQGNFE